MAGDPDIASDFIVAPTTTVDVNFFTFTGMRALVGGAPPTTFKVLKATLAEFLALNLNGQSVSYTVLQFPSGNTNLHTLILAPLSSSS
ncbi:putative germin-like protein 9-2 [Prunus yedoensis var. nudiflora]|uniref:Putative germin-like protein 9-2 n=1 Tax=Prunus yedoensis var. nudiflora TaxID=2094558 RepID=A0A314ZCB4_PRUYE|nr:putative germin-like protein 9-2 [Prunus yedoensis var. nudiflora]